MPHINTAFVKIQADLKKSTIQEVIRLNRITECYNENEFLEALKSMPIEQIAKIGNDMIIWWALKQANNEVEKHNNKDKLKNVKSQIKN